MFLKPDNPAPRAARALAAAGVLCLPVPAMAQQTTAPQGAAEGPPLSAVEWLDEAAPMPVAVPITPSPPPVPGEPPVAGTALSPDVEVRALDAPSVSAVGLLPPAVTGFPLALWRGSDPPRLARLLAGVETDALPALQALLFSLLLAEADPPARSRGEDLLVARLDRLIAQGAVAPALALVERAGPGSPALFARWFDLMLLTGETAAACAALTVQPELSDDLAARVYCLTLTGQWDAAIATLEGARLLGDIDPQMADLLWLFVDPELAEEERPPRIAAARVTPLIYRLLQALGEAPPPSLLPRAYASMVITGDAGWRAQIEAAERMARAGAAPANTLIGVYSEREPAASGGVWDRVEAIQQLDRAITDRDTDRVESWLPRAWAQARAAGLGVPVATLFAERLTGLPLTGASAELARDLVYLSPGYEGAAAAFPDTPASAARAFLAGLAIGEPDAAKATTPVQEAIAAAFADTTPPEELRGMLAQDRLGEAILEAMQDVSRGAAGDPQSLGRGLRHLRALGLEDTARRAALQLVILGSAR